MLANWQTGSFRKRGVKITVKRGQLARSKLELADRWRWSRGKVTRFLDELESDQQILQQTSKLTTLISIINYDRYQSDGTTDEATDGHQTDIYKKNKKR